MAPSSSDGGDLSRHRAAGAARAETWHGRFRAGRHSWIEAVHQDELLVLRHVCVEAHQIHFFHNASAAELFNKLREPYRAWQSVDPGRHVPPEWRFSTVVHDEPMTVHDNLLRTARWVRETSFLWVPHKASPHNLYHFLNNLFLPLWRNAILSASEHLPKRLFLFKLWPLDLSGMLNKLQPKQWPHNMTMSAFFSVLQKLFLEVAWPVEDLWADGRAICFDRFVWSQQLRTTRFPYQASTPQEWRYRDLNVSISARDAIRHALQVEPPSPRASSSDRPSVVWISRQSSCTPSRDPMKGIGRCVRNMGDVVDFLRRTKLFATVRVIDRFELHEDASARDAQLREQLELLKTADILIGVHGAGLGHIAYLERRSAVVELLDQFWFQRHYHNRSRLRQSAVLADAAVQGTMYSAMARVQGCGYVAADLRLSNFTTRGYVLDATHMQRLGQIALAAWKKTQLVAHDACCQNHKVPRPIRCICQAKNSPLNVVIPL